VGYEAEILAGMDTNVTAQLPDCRGLTPKQIAALGIEAQVADRVLGEAAPEPKFNSTI
jgi:hypothetical protein